MKFMPSLKRVLLTGLLAALWVLPAHATLLDPLDTTANFENAINVTLSAPSPGEVSIIRTAFGVDALIDWKNAGSNLNLLSEPLLAVYPVGVVDGGRWNVSVLYFTNSLFAGEFTLVPTTTSAATFETNLFVVAQANGVTTDSTTEYFLRFRIPEGPGQGSAPGFTFTAINATIPEPAVVSLMLLGGGFWIWQRRKSG